MLYVPSVHTLAYLAERRPPTGDRPAVVMVVGVNGTGKTTTCGKLARVLVADGRTVLLGAADTFRAAAIEQLKLWGQRLKVEVVAGAYGADAASVAHDAVAAAQQRPQVTRPSLASRVMQMMQRPVSRALILRLRLCSRQ